jgi:hypothetical protein
MDNEVVIFSLLVVAKIPADIAGHDLRVGKIFMPEH